VFVAIALVRAFRVPHRVRIVVTGLVVITLAATTHVRAREWADSYALWRSVLRTFPTTPLAWQNLTSAYYLDGDIPQAAEIALQAVEATRGDHDSAANAISLLTTTGRLAEAENLLEAARKTQPESPELALQAGLLALRQEHVEDARNAFHLASRLRPGWAQPHLDRSYAEERGGDLEGATSAVAEALSLDPKSEYAHRRFVELLIKSGQWERSLIAAERMTDLCPYSVDGWEMRIFILEKAGRHDDAEHVRESARSRVSLPEGN
jgi:tetratricopeptide (TPR) repeat protein